MVSPKLELQRRRFVAQKGDEYAIPDSKDDRRGLANQFAKELANTKVDKANIHGLETLAWSTESIADILDYIRVRVGRDSNKRSWAKGGVVVRLAKVLERDIRKDAEAFYKDKTVYHSDAIRQLHLELCREFISHLRSLYEFYKAQRGKDDEEES